MSTPNAESVRHNVRWFARFPDTPEEDWIPRSKRMQGGGWGWDVRCSCGWATRTGGATERSIREEVAMHRLLAGAQNDGSGAGGALS